MSSDQTIEEEMGLAGAVAEDAEAECIRRITDTQIVTGYCTLCTNCTVSVLSNRNCFKMLMHSLWRQSYWFTCHEAAINVECAALCHIAVLCSLAYTIQLCIVHFMLLTLSYGLGVF